MNTECIIIDIMSGVSKSSLGSSNKVQQIEMQHGNKHSKSQYINGTPKHHSLSA